MRSTTVAVAGLAAVASADVLTVTSTQDVTVTYCAPSVTNCPAKSTWNEWEPIPTTTSSSSTWNEWEPIPTTSSSSTWATWDNTKPYPTSGNTWSTWSPEPPKPTNWQNVPNEGGDYVYWIDESGKKWSTPAWQEWNGNVPKPTNAWVEWVDNSVTKTVTYDWANWNNAPAPTGSYVYWVDNNGQKYSTPAWQEWDSKTPKPTNAWVEWVDNSGKKSTSAWAGWQNVPAKPTPVANDQWASWSAIAKVTAACPKYTASGAPEWFKSLPAEAASSMAGKWANGPPMDWCYYSYSTAAVKTSTYAAGASWSNVEVKPTATYPGNAQWSNVAKYTGAANANSGSLAMAGLAGLAAIIMA